MYFIGGAAGIIFLLTFSGLSGLNLMTVGGNLPLIIMMSASLLPIGFISFFKSHWTLLQRLILVTSIQTLAFVFLIYLSPIEEPFLYVSENLTLPLAVISCLFLFHIGHAFISGSTIFLLKLNQGVKLKISWHITILSSLYFLLVLFTLLELMGEVSLPFPTLPPIVLMILAGLLGYYVLQFKIDQTTQVYDHPIVGPSCYLIGFAICILTWNKGLYTENQALIDFLNHTFLYGQIALSLLFFGYLMTNFSSIINQGSEIEKVLFKPQFFAYFHMRIGSVMTLVILVIFANGIIVTQLSSASSIFSADYYYMTDRPQHARILYENAWDQYHRNDRVKNMTAHLYFSEKQPALGLRHLEESFDFAPSILNIILYSNKLHQSNKVLDAIFYLEKGLEKFPKNEYLANNLALLYAKTNRPKEAISVLKDLEDPSEVVKANLLALAVRHQIDLEKDVEPKDDPIQHINLLALENKKGNFADFTVDFQQVPNIEIVKAAAIRNQWSNHTNSPLTTDLSYIDSLISIAQTGLHERNFLGSRIIRLIQDDEINEALKYLSGAVITYPNQAEEFQLLAADLLISQVDLEKAAKELALAVATQSTKIKPHHLAVLYFGDREAAAKAYIERFQASFPPWMTFELNGELISNDQVAFFRILGKFHQKTGKQLLAEMNMLSADNLKTDLAYFLMLHKAHWFSMEEMKLLKSILTQSENTIWDEDEFDSYVAYLKNGKTDKLPKNIKKLIKPELSPTRNAYLTPLILLEVAQLNDALQRYEILQEAIQHNKDPKLWMAYAKESRTIGLGNYATKALEELANWVEKNEFEKLLMENL
ncbi:tetratricopeptide repeat protein [Belliella kenyensis]|nr:tetratricopeptide repeat protein [Belliella kenyensis]MDN3601521.1 tetratricopeptide repeat protein [Belliella kenyensis]